MAMAVAGGGGRGGRRGRRRGGGGNRPMSDINVTPMVDVPQTQARQMAAQSEPITVSVTPEGAIFIGDQPTTLETLVEQVGTIAVNGTEDRLYVRGDSAASYGTVMQVMGRLSGAGYSKIGLITDQEQR